MAREVEAKAATFSRAGDASEAAPELEEAARYRENIVSTCLCDIPSRLDAIEGGCGVSGIAALSLGNGRARGGWRTLEMVTGPFRSPLRARVERKQDLANMIGKLDRFHRESRNRGESAMRVVRSRGSGVERAQSRGHSFNRIRENPAFRNGPTLIGPGHVPGWSLGELWL